MKKIVVASVVLTFMFIGCGSSSSSDASEPKKEIENSSAKADGYYLWSYFTPANSNTNSFSLYNDGKSTQYKTTYSVKQDRVIEQSDNVSNEKTIYEKLSNSIRVKFEKNGKPNGMYELKLYANIGDVVTVRDSSCKLYKHYDNLTIKGKSFNDVIEIRCSNRPGYYEKGVGEIAQMSDKDSRSVRVLSN